MRRLVLALVRLSVLMAAGAVLLGAPARAQDDARAGIVERLCTRDTEARIAAVDALLGGVAAKQIPADWAAAIIDAAGDASLKCGEGGVRVIAKAGRFRDPLTLADAPEPSVKVAAPFVNLRVRATYEMAGGLLLLITSPSSPQGGKAADNLQKHSAIANLDALQLAVAAQPSPDLAERLQSIAAFRALRHPDLERRIAAINTVAADPTERNRTALLDLQGDKSLESDPKVGAALSAAIASVDRWLQLSRVLATVYSGLSYASILFMAALGLAVIFGLMGVINLAQGELIMVGAYTTYLVQEAIRAAAPGLLDAYLLIAIPVAFVVTALVGVLMEITVIRHLYRRPLMTLLATWAISLLLINLVRVFFGTQNLEFVTPAFLSGGERIVGDFIVTYNRLFAIVFALGILIGALIVLRRTKLGLFIRAVTENRDMAGCVGVSARRVDVLSFGIGSGLAGLAGLALSPIYTVNPNMGTNFIVDAFMIVVLGGVGSLIGTLIASVNIGMINVIIEPAYGAVAAKVIVLLLIIIFIQFRPEGLFAPKGRR